MRCSRATLFKLCCLNNSCCLNCGKGLSTACSCEVMNCQTRKFPGGNDESKKVDGEYRGSSVGLSLGQGFWALIPEFHSAKPFKHKTQHWYKCWHLGSFCCLNESWKAVDKKTLGLLEYKQWGNFYVKSEERSPMDYRFNRCKSSWVKILHSGVFSPSKRVSPTICCTFFRKLEDQSQEFLPGNSAKRNVHAGTEVCKALCEETTLVFSRCALLLIS